MIGEGPPAYAVGQFRDPATELARLRQQAAILEAAEESALRELGLPETGRVLDVGCGPGFVAARIAKARPEISIIGIDMDPAVIGRAKNLIDSTSKGRAVFVRGLADSLPFPDAQFDAVYARLVLRHLPRPDGALKEVHRVLRPGGRAIVIDSDDGALVVHPWPQFFGEVLAARQETFKRRAADPFIGRRLPSLLREAGFDVSRARPLVVDSISVGRSAFARVVLDPIADAIDEDLLSRRAVAATLGGIRAWEQSEDSFGMTTVLAFEGLKS